MKLYKLLCLVVLTLAALTAFGSNAPTLAPTTLDAKFDRTVFEARPVEILFESPTLAPTPAWEVEPPIKSSWGAIYNYDLTSKTSAAFVGYRLAPIEGILGRDWEASLWGVAGAGFNEGVLAGFAVTFDWQAARNGYVTLGGSWTKPMANQATRWGLVAGWRVEF